MAEKMAESRQHRSYRRLELPRRRYSVISIVALAVLEYVLWINFSRINYALSNVSASMLGNAAGPISIYEEQYGPLNLYPLHFFTPAPDYRGLLIWIIACVILMILLVLFKQYLPAPFRFITFYNLMIVAVSALYLLFFGTMGYDAEAFSSLYVATCAIILGLLPIIAWTYGFFLGPQSLALLVVAALVYEFCFSAARYALIVLTLHWCGTVLMPTLFLSFGPLMDFVLFVGIFSMFLPWLARSKDHGPWR